MRTSRGIPEEGGLMHHVVHHVQFLKISVRGKIGHMKEYGDVIVRTAEFAPYKSKYNRRLALQRVDVVVNLEQPIRA